jgi:hypothetical protein
MSCHYYYESAYYLSKEFKKSIGVKSVIGQAHNKCYGAANEYAQYFNVEARGFVRKQNGNDKSKKKDHVERDASQCWLGVGAPPYFVRFFSPDTQRLHELKKNVIDDERKKKTKKKEGSKYEGVIKFHFMV